MDTPLVYITLVLALGIIAQWAAWRFRLPSILLLLAFGFIAGQVFDIKVDNFLGENADKLILDIAGLCVAIILFEGGLTLKFSELKQSGVSVFRICTIGVLVAFLATTAFCMYLIPLSWNFDHFGLNWRIAAVMGAILVVTGPTVVAPLLRHIQPTRKIGSIVKWEGIVVDPIGAILAVLVFQVALANDIGDAQLSVMWAFTRTILVGGLLAYLIAKGIEKLLKHHLIPDYLHPVFLLCVVAISFTVSNLIQKESGLLTVTVLGMVLANQKSVSVKHILEFKENLQLLIISGLFIVLSGRIDGERLVDALPGGLSLLIVLIVFIRPASIFLANLFTSKLSFKEQFFLSLLAPRGIVAAAVMSLFAIEFAHVIDANQVSFSPELKQTIKTQASAMEPYVFIVIIGTVTFYGLLAGPMAKLLGISKRNPMGVLFAGSTAWSRMLAKSLMEDGHDVLMLDTNFSNITAAKEDGIPANRANILSEYVEEELDLAGLGTLLAITPNDEVNSLATKEFTHIFGRANVWQIAPNDAGKHHTTTVSNSHRGRICFANSPSQDDIDQLMSRGAVIKRTTLSEQYSYDDFLHRYEKRSIVLFLDLPDKGLRPAEQGMREPSSGTKIYALIVPKERN